MQFLRPLFAALFSLVLCGAASAGTVIAVEDGSFTLTQPTTVRFGIGNNWVSANLLPGTYFCGVNLFGDPIVGLDKHCEAETAATPSTTPSTPTPAATTPTATADAVDFAPPCYPWDSAAQATKVTTQPDGNLKWMLESANQASWIVTWFCADPEGALPQSISGYRNEIAPFQVLDAFRGGSKEERDAAWNASATCTSNRDPNSAACQKYASLKPLVRAQLVETCPAGCLIKP